VEGKNFGKLVISGFGVENFVECSIPVLWQEENFGKSSFANSLKLFVFNDTLTHDP